MHKYTIVYLVLLALALALLVLIVADAATGHAALWTGLAIIVVGALLGTLVLVDRRH
jgi:hypothetical protein